MVGTEEGTNGLARGGAKGLRIGDSCDPALRLLAADVERVCGAAEALD